MDSQLKIKVIFFIWCAMICLFFTQINFEVKWYICFQFLFLGIFNRSKWIRKNLRKAGEDGRENEVNFKVSVIKIPI